MERLLFDLRYATRRLARSPGFATAAILILGLGIGASTAVFSAVDNILFRPLDLPDSERLLTLCETHQGDRAYCTASPANAMDWQASARTLEEIGVARERHFEIHQGASKTGMRAAMATPGFLRALGVKPLHGRLLTEDDMRPRGPGTAVLLTYDAWKNDLGGDPALVGRTIIASSSGDGGNFEKQPVTIVGVLPEDVEIPRLSYARAWIPFQFDPRDEEHRGWRGFVAVGRLAEGATPASAQAELNRIHAQLAEVHPEEVRNWTVETVRMRDYVVGDTRSLLLLFLAAVGIVLAIVCVNLMSLLLTRATQRERELTVRAALGAGRGRLLEQLLIEAILLAVLGGIAGVLIAAWLVDVFIAIAPPGVPRISDVTIDGRILAFAIAVTAITGVLFGLAPVSRIRAMRLHDSLKSARTTIGTRGGTRVRNILVVAQLAMALTLVLSAGLLLRSFGRLVAYDPGFELENLLTFQVFPPAWRYDEREKLIDFYGRLKQELEAIPGVTSVGTTSAGPLFGGGDGRTPFLVSGRPVVPKQDAPTVQWYNAGPGYFPTLGVPILQGRNLSEADRSTGTTTALINQAMAARHWPGVSPIGARLSLPDWGADVEIVGVVPDLIPFEGQEAPEPSIFVSDRQRPRGASFFVVRTATDAAATVPAVRRVFQRLEPDAEPGYFMTMEERLGEQLVGPRFNLVLIGLFAAIALLLSAFGIYAVIAYAVATRTREFGIRMALGAMPGQVLRSVLVDGGRLLAAGLIFGGAGAYFFTRLLRGVVHDVAPTDPIAVLGTVLLLGVAATLASIAPAMRASRADPASVLRSE